MRRNNDYKRWNCICPTCRKLHVKVMFWTGDTTKPIKKYCRLCEENKNRVGNSLGEVGILSGGYGGKRFAE